MQSRFTVLRIHNLAFIYLAHKFDVMYGKIVCMFVMLHRDAFIPKAQHLLKACAIFFSSELPVYPKQVEGPVANKISIKIK